MDCGFQCLFLLWPRWTVVSGVYFYCGRDGLWFPVSLYCGRDGLWFPVSIFTVAEVDSRTDPGGLRSGDPPFEKKSGPSRYIYTIILASRDMLMGGGCYSKIHGLCSGFRRNHTNIQSPIYICVAV